MPPLIVAVLVGAAAYAGFRAAREIWTQVAAPRPSADPDPASSDYAPAEREFKKDLGTLEYDPVAGVYRPRDPR